SLLPVVSDGEIAAQQFTRGYNVTSHLEEENLLRAHIREQEKLLIDGSEKVGGRKRGGSDKSKRRQPSSGGDVFLASFLKENGRDTLPSSALSSLPPSSLPVSSLSSRLSSIVLSQRSYLQNSLSLINSLTHISTHNDTRIHTSTYLLPYVCNEYIPLLKCVSEGVLEDILMTGASSTKVKAQDQPDFATTHHRQYKKLLSQKVVTKSYSLTRSNFSRVVFSADFGRRHNSPYLCPLLVALTNTQTNTGTLIFPMCEGGDLGSWCLRLKEMKDSSSSKGTKKSSWSLFGAKKQHVSESVSLISPIERFLIPSPPLLYSSPTPILIQLLLIFRDILCAVCFLHSKGYVHCDIKPENILLRKDGSNSKSGSGMMSLEKNHDYRAKGLGKAVSDILMRGLLGDFDGIMDITELAQQKTSKTDRSGQKTDTYTKSHASAPSRPYYHMAPELRGSHPSVPTSFSDIYAIGTSMRQCAMTCGVWLTCLKEEVSSGEPHSHHHSAFGHIDRSHQDPCPCEGCQYARLVEHMTCETPQQRRTAAELLRDPMFDRKLLVRRFLQWQAKQQSHGRKYIPNDEIPVSLDMAIVMLQSLRQKQKQIRKIRSELYSTGNFESLLRSQQSCVKSNSSSPLPRSTASSRSHSISESSSATLPSPNSGIMINPPSSPSDTRPPSPSTSQESSLRSFKSSIHHLNTLINGAKQIEKQFDEEIIKIMRECEEEWKEEENLCSSLVSFSSESSSTSSFTQPPTRAVKDDGMLELLLESCGVEKEISSPLS
ncbi:hypothetical protein ADUPG1_013749, partial [Aduncisulcus paluster]